MNKIIIFLIKHRPCFIFGHRFTEYKDWLKWSLGEEVKCSNCNKKLQVKGNK